MVWGGIWKGGRTDLVVMVRDSSPEKRGGYTSKSYTMALREGLLPIYDGTRHFQQDNAAIHRSQETMAWLANKAIEVLDYWPPHSPDLNPIEHVWAAMKRILAKLYPDIWELKKNELNVVEFTRCLKEAWHAVDQDFIDKLIDSIARRLTAVKKARGWYTRY
jgi:hypothetical protein